jgi:hypothetical protein
LVTSRRICIKKISVALWVPLGGLMCYLLNFHTDLGVFVCRNYRHISIILPIINKESNYLKKAARPYLLRCFCRNVERSNYTFYRLGHCSRSFSGHIFYVIKIYLLVVETWYYSFWRVVIITLINGLSWMY